MGRIFAMQLQPSVAMRVITRVITRVMMRVAVASTMVGAMAGTMVVLAAGCVPSRLWPPGGRAEPRAATDSALVRGTADVEARARTNAQEAEAAQRVMIADAARAAYADSIRRTDAASAVVAAKARTAQLERAAADSIALLPPPIAWDLAVESNATRTRVTYFAEVFTGRARPAFEIALSRQTRFAPLISEKLRAGGLPLDLTYLALIESWYNPDAYSKAAAVGMWQFMAGTARGVGLRVDWWIDERRDPVRSTEGAVKLLSSLHDDFGSFFLAAAAYNGGSGRVSRGLTQFATRVDPFEGEDKFFALSDTHYLRPETRDYVPKMIAAALVAKQPDKYGLQVESQPRFEFDSVLAPSGAPLPAIAAAAPTAMANITELNPHILRGMLPTGDAIWVRVPKGTSEGFDERFSALDSADRVALKRVTTKTGESISSIARKNKLTAKQLNWFNPQAQRLKSGNLVAGQPLFVPSAAVVAAARDVPNPSIERYPRRRATPSQGAATNASKPASKPASIKPKPAAMPRGADTKLTTKVPVTKGANASAQKAASAKAKRP